jgi:SAM-dependent methyltransferase
VADPSWGIEVAEPPDLRSARRGAALAPERVVDLVRVAAAQGPRTDWERAYEGDPASLPWHVEQVPEDLARALAELPAPRSLLDLGTGLGTVARYAAELGHRVVATDVSRAALRRAAERAGDLPITFVRDDLTDTRLAGWFDVAVDRGLLHTLDERELSSYANAVAGLVRPGGTLLLVSDGHQARAGRRTLRLSPQELAARLPGFTLRDAAETTLCPDDPGTAWLTVWTRTA